MKPRTPAGSINGDDAGMSISETSSSFGAIAMDVDGVSTCKHTLYVVSDVYRLQPLGSPLLSSMPNSINQWRYTPPPTTSAVRSNKRKREISFSSGLEALGSLINRNLVEDRFDPYPSSSKRRAVSPSLQYLRDSHQPTNSPMSRNNGSRLPIAIPISIPQSTASSTTSSPTISNSYPSFPRGINITSSPTLRATLTMPSPILRPLGRRREEEEQREIEGAGEAVSGLNLGCQSTLFTLIGQQELIYSIIGQIPNFLNQMNRPLWENRRKIKFTSSEFLVSCYHTTNSIGY
jgi:hypothetical protein